MEHNMKCEWRIVGLQDQCSRLRVTVIFEPELLEIGKSEQTYSTKLCTPDVGKDINYITQDKFLIQEHINILSWVIPGYPRIKK